MVEFMPSITPVVLCGGRGTRLWPFSHQGKPKQFVKLPEMQHSMLQSTLIRLKDSGLNLKPPIIVVQGEFLWLLQEQIQEIEFDVGNIIVESRQSGTAVAATMALGLIERITGGELALILPIDHHFDDPKPLFRSVGEIAPLLSQEISIFGIAPTRDEPNYGYLKVDPMEHLPGLHKVQHFLEKPKKIPGLHQPREWYWNLGIFLAKATSFADQVQEFAPDLYYHAHDSLQRSIAVGANIFVPPADLSNKPSIDDAIIAKSNNVVAAIIELGWHDLGNLSAVWELAKKDDYGNVSGSEDILMDTHNSYVFGAGKPTVVLGLEDVFVINGKDALLVTSKKSLATASKFYESPINQISVNSFVKAPWGYHYFIVQSAQYVVKKIYIEALKRTSLQYHEYRDEHMVVVSGIATITVGVEKRVLGKQDMISIPRYCVHRIENRDAQEPLVILELQIGNPVCEQDIVRMHDDYGRLIE